jgi:hypothetical protein
MNVCFKSKKNYKGKDTRVKIQGFEGSKVLGSMFGVKDTAFKEGLQSFNPQRGTVNMEPLGFRVQRL